MADKIFVVVLAAERIGLKTIRVSGDKVHLVAEGYKITKDSETIFVSSFNHVRYIQEEKSQCDNAEPGGQRAEQCLTPGFDPELAKDVADKAKSFSTSPALAGTSPRFTSLREMANDFLGKEPPLSVPLHQRIAVNSFVEYLENRLRDTMLTRR